MLTHCHPDKRTEAYRVMDTLRAATDPLLLALKGEQMLEKFQFRVIASKLSNQCKKLLFQELKV